MRQQNSGYEPARTKEALPREHDDLKEQYETDCGGEGVARASGARVLPGIPRLKAALR